MKAKTAITAIAILALLALAVFKLGGRTAQPGTPEHARKVLNAGVTESLDILAPPAAERPDRPEQSSTSLLPRPSAEDVVEIHAGSGDNALRLERAGTGWDIVGAASAPANTEKITALLTGLLTAEFHSIPENETSAAGLENDGGLPIRLTVSGGSNYEMRLGVRPEGNFDSVYARMPTNAVGILSADIRGILGLWKNVPEAVPNPAAWMEKRILHFDPEDAVRIEATYPDHQIAFEKNPGGEWEPRGYVPGGEWDRTALENWVRDLAKFEASGVEKSGELDKETQGRHKITITLDDGTEKTIRVAVNHTGEGMLAESTEYPGHLFTLPEWRFRRYFRRLRTLFPQAVPHCNLADIRFIDIRQDGETVKLASLPTGWTVGAWSYPLRTGKIEQLARMLSAWQPEDYAAPDFKAIRPLFAGPIVEVSLADGRVHQYRLAGRHPLYPWRYVIVDNTSIFSVTDEEADLLFPELVEVLDFGKTVSVATAETIREIRLEDGQENPIATLRREDVDSIPLGDDPDGAGNPGEREGDDGSSSVWKVETEYGAIVVQDADVAVVIRKMLEWSPSGLYIADSQTVKPAPLYHVRILANDSADQGIQFFESDGQTIPYIAEGHRSFVLERRVFFNWLGAIRTLGERIHAGRLSESEAPEANPEPREMPRDNEAESVEELPVEIVPEVQPQPDEPELIIPSALSVPSAQEETAHVYEYVESGDASPVHIPLTEPHPETTIMTADGMEESDPVYVSPVAQ